MLIEKIENIYTAYMQRIGTYIFLFLISCINPSLSFNETKKFFSTVII